MKVKVLCRNPADYVRETKSDIRRLPRNYDPSLHPFELQREYTRALNAAKTERLLAKPFIGNLTGHREGVCAMAKHSHRLPLLISGAFDGQLKLWNLMTRDCLDTVNVHSGCVRSLAFYYDSDTFLSCGSDRLIKEWNIDSIISGNHVQTEPTNSIKCRATVLSVDTFRSCTGFVSCGGDGMSVWDRSRNEPLHVFSWSNDSHTCVRCNPIEQRYVLSCANDRSVHVYDVRVSKIVSKVILRMCSSGACWNPMEASVFTLANDDYNLYTFDMRNLRSAEMIHQDNTAAVMDVDYSPTGHEFVSAGYDRTIRIYDRHSGHSRDVYHTQRMQRVLCVRWTMDSKYILSGSDEMDIRIWKANASEKLGLLAPREREALAYAENLKEKFADFPMIKRIAHHRHVPKFILNAQRERHIMLQSEYRKAANRKLHAGKNKKRRPTPARKRMIVKVEK
ncbi:hypothetical protein ACOME3_007326 [Neoechinorhynchus agilis]